MQMKSSNYWSKPDHTILVFLLIFQQFSIM